MQILRSNDAVLQESAFQSRDVGAALVKLLVSKGLIRMEDVKACMGEMRVEADRLHQEAIDKLKKEAREETSALVLPGDAEYKVFGG